MSSREGHKIPNKETENWFPRYGELILVGRLVREHNQVQSRDVWSSTVYQSGIVLLPHEASRSF